MGQTSLQVPGGGGGGGGGGGEKATTFKIARSIALCSLHGHHQIGVGNLFRE